MSAKSELRCCLGCGRDTRGLYCFRCGGRNPVVGRGRGYPAAVVHDLPLEDDYGEESDADSVCEDNSASVSGV